MRALLAAIAAAAIAALLYFGMDHEPEHVASTLPPDPAGRQAALRAALAATGHGPAAAGALVGQAVLETGNFKAPEFALTLSAWNRHVGTGENGDWNGRVCMLNDAGVWTVYDDDEAALAVDPTNAREHLRCFDSLEQACRDMDGLLALSIYAAARAALAAGDARAYAAAIAKGNGKKGFVGDSSAKKAADYTAGLLREYAALGVA